VIWDMFDCVIIILFLIVCLVLSVVDVGGNNHGSF
jgi:hypothetical protein